MSLTIPPAEIVKQAEVSGNPGLLAKAPTWDRIPLGDTARVVNGAPFPSGGFNSEGQGMPLIRIRDIAAAKTQTWFNGPWEKQHLVRNGDILVGMDGDFRVEEWRGNDALLNQRVCRLAVDESRYNKRFLSLTLQGYLDAIWRETSSITVKHLSSRSVAEIPLPFPPLDEQRRIVELLEDHLSRLDAAERGLTMSLVKLNALQKQTIFHALTGVGSQDREALSLAEAGTDDDILSSLPVGWSWARLGDVADVVGGVTKDSKKQSDPSFVEVPYLRVANVQRGHLNLETVTRLRVNPAKAKALRLEHGDVLLNEGGDRDKLARGWVWEDQVEDCIHQNHVFRARLHEDRLNPYFLSWTTNSFGGPWAERNGKQSVNLASISLSMIKKMPVIVPAAGEAEEVVASLSDTLETYDRLAAALTSARQRGAALRRSLLAAAFSGRLTSDHLDHALEKATL